MVDLRALVAVGLRPARHAAARGRPGGAEHRHARRLGAGTLRQGEPHGAGPPARPGARERRAARPGEGLFHGRFQRLEAVLASEGATLAPQRAALLAFSVAVVAYNYHALAVVHAALGAEAAAPAPADTAPGPISLYAGAPRVREHDRGLLVAVPAAAWAPYRAADPARLALTLRALATHVRLPAPAGVPQAVTRSQWAAPAKGRRAGLRAACRAATRLHRPSLAAERQQRGQQAP